MRLLRTNFTLNSDISSSSSKVRKRRQYHVCDTFFHYQLSFCWSIGEMYYHSFLFTLILILLTAPLSQCIQFSQITPSAGNNNSSTSSSSSLMLNWAREPKDPPFWALNAIFTVNGKFSASNGLGFEFIAVPHSPENSGIIQIPVQATAFNLPQHSKFSGEIFGQPFTFDVVTEGSSMPKVSPGILPPMVQKMLTPPPPTTSHKVATIIGAVIGLIVFLSIILALFVLHRRRHRHRARIDAEALLRKHHALHRPTSLPPTLTTFDDERQHEQESVRYSSTAWSEGGSEKEPLYGYPSDYLGHTTYISPTLSRKAEAVSTPTPRARLLNNSISSRTEKLGNDPTSESVSFLALPIPRNSLAPNRTLLYLQSPHSSSPSYLFLPEADQGYSIEQSLVQLRGRMKLLLKQLDSDSLESNRDSADRIGDEAEMIQIKLEMDRLQRILDSE
ncbi:hypothetical protein EV368DRAFT_63860 [Lentinula lateritia]|nr:hypothetical protein EV368DRAFT_63860 [Lentinula lateritia]